jgi:hypothetical protein
MSAPNPVIFLAYSNDRADSSRYLRDLVREVRNVRYALEDRTLAPYTIEERGNATLEDIIRTFDRHEGRVEIFHFAGHAEDFQLLLENEGGSQEAANAGGLVRFLASQVGLRLVFLNGCATEAQADMLVQAGIPAVICTAQRINDAAARIFSERFYERLADRKGIQSAFEAAEIKVQTAMQGQQATTSVLYWGEDAATQTGFPWRLKGEDTGWTLQRISPKKSGSLTPLLCDRVPQSESFRDTVESVLSDNLHVPHFYFLYGNREERHQSLVERFRYTDIRRTSEKLFGEEAAMVDFYAAKDFPQTGDLAMRQRNIRRSLALATNYTGIGTDWNADVLTSLHRKRKGAVVYQHTLAGDAWDAITEQLLAWYIGTFWQVSLSGDMPQVIIFLNIVTPAAAQAASFFKRLSNIVARRDSLEDSLRTLVKSFQDRATLLNRLEPISYADVANWVAEHFPSELRTLPDTLFGSERDKRLPMEIVEDALKAEIAKIERQQMIQKM